MKSREIRLRKMDFLNFSFFLSVTEKGKINQKQVSPEYSFILNAKLQTTAEATTLVYKGKMAFNSVFLLCLSSLQEEP